MRLVFLLSGCMRSVVFYFINLFLKPLYLVYLSRNELIETLRSYIAGSYQIRLILGSLLAAIVADGVITEFLVLNGFAYEGNPFLQFWVGKDVFLTIKLLGGLLAILYLWNIYRRNTKLAICCSSLFLTAYTFIIYSNLLILW